MALPLITSWHDYQHAMGELLSRAQTSVKYFDADLGALDPEQPVRHALLKQLCCNNPGDVLTFIVRRDLDPNREHPRTAKLLRTYPGHLQLQRCAETCAGLRDNLLLVDGRHGLIRFDETQPRARLILDEPAAMQAYLARFEALLAEGGTPIRATPLGL